MSVCQPETTYDLLVVAQVIKLTKKDIKALNKRF
jgi:hypothetical protein